MSRTFLEVMVFHMRQFRDEAGVEWQVSLTARGSDAVSREHALPEAYREGWLVFESAQQKRRLAPVPPNWESLPAEALAALCARALPQVTRTRGLGEAKVGAEAEPLRPKLRQAEQQLERTLAEVCETPNPSQLDTGDLIRIEENLAVATQGANGAGLARRRLRADKERSDQSDSSSSTTPGSEGASRGNRPR